MKVSRPWVSMVLVMAACGGGDGRDSETTAGGPTGSQTTTVGTESETDTESGNSMSGGSNSDSDNTTVGPTSDDPTQMTTDGPTTDPTDPTESTSETETTMTTMTTGPDCTPECSEDGTEVLCGGFTVESCDALEEYCVDATCVYDPCGAAANSKRSEGCDFWSVKTNLIVDADGACFAAFVANTWDEPVHLGVEYMGQDLPVADMIRIPQGQGANISYQPYDPIGGLPVGEVAILFLSRGPGGFPDCPSPAGVLQETAVPGTGTGAAFNITSDFPVAAYQMLPYGGGSVAATSATLLLPTGTWGTNYVAINAYQKSEAVAHANPLVTLVAQEDNTEVTILPKVAIVGGNGVAAGPANQSISYNLNRGETIQFEQPQELTGSPIETSVPVGMFGGASCLNVPVNQTACDGAHQQIPPINALGSSYTGVRYRNRANQEESPPWRLVGAVDGTTLTWFPATPPGAPTTINLGEIAEFNHPGPFQVQSQDDEHPFYIASYMTGGAPYNGIGDPEWVNIVPDPQFLEDYVLFTDPTYSETSLVVVRTPVDGQFAEVNLECAGNLTGWQPVGENEYTRIDLVTGNFQDVGGCSNGRHEMSSDNPFGVTVWGWGSPASQFFNTVYVSYAYPAGASVAAINEVDVPIE